MRIVRALLISIITVSAVQAQWFEGRGTAYQAPDGKWVDAAVNFQGNRIDVYFRKHKDIVASFTAGVAKNDTTSGETTKKSRIKFKKVLAILLTGLAGGFANNYVGNGNNNGNGNGNDDDEATEPSRTRESVIIAAAAGVVAAYFGLTKDDLSLVEITEGKKTARLRFGKKDAKRLESTLAKFLAN